MTMNTEDWKDAFPTASKDGLPKDEWEKKLLDNEKTAPAAGVCAPLAAQPAVNEPSASEPEKPAEPAKEDNVPPFGEDNSPKNAKHGPYRNLWSFLLLLTFAVSSVCGIMLVLKPGVTCPAVKEKPQANVSFMGNLSKSSGPGVAWIKIRGVIAESNDSGPFSRPSGASAIAKRIRSSAADDNVKAIVLDINSPGGTVASVQNIYSELLAAKAKGKKVVALFRDVAASGGFYVAMAADQIVAEPGTITGSVGVIMQTSNLEGLFNKLGITITPITSGKYKDIGSSFRPMSDAEKALLQDMVSETYTQFFAAVKAGRPNVKPEDLTEYTDGRVFTGERAFKLGFVDQLGGEEEARLLAGELAGIKDPKIISQRGDGLRDVFLSFGSNLEGKNMAKQLESLTTPSVSYLWMN